MARECGPEAVLAKLGRGKKNHVHCQPIGNPWYVRRTTLGGLVIDTISEIGQSFSRTFSQVSVFRETGRQD